MVKKGAMAKLKFITTISKMGEDNKIIWIPKRFHPELEKFEGKQVRIVIDDEF